MVMTENARVGTSEAARILGVSEGTVRNWLRDGRLPHERTALGALIQRHDLAALISERERRQRERITTRGVQPPPPAAST